MNHLDSTKQSHDISMLWAEHSVSMFVSFLSSLAEAAQQASIAFPCVVAAYDSSILQ